MTTEERLRNLEKSIENIKARNARVEADKAWEVSLTRTASIAGVTYLVTAFVFYLIEVESYWLSALVPAAAYFISVQSLPSVKRWWITKVEEDRNWEKLAKSRDNKNAKFLPHRKVW